MSIVTVLVAAGLMGGLALMLAQMSKQQHVNQKKAETGVEVVALSQRIVRTLYDGDACAKSIGAGATIAPGGTFAVNAIKSKSGKDVIVTGQTYGNRLVKISSMNLTIDSDPIAGNQAEAVLEVVMSRESAAYTGQKTVAKSFDLTLELDGSNNLLRCASDVSAVAEPVKKEICSDIGGSWDDSLKKCTFGRSCAEGEYLASFDASGKVCKSRNLRCSKQGEVMVGISNGVADCVPMAAAPAPAAEPPPVGDCSSLTESQLRSAFGYASGDYAEIDVNSTCEGETKASNDQCSNSSPTYTDYAPLGCCYQEGNLARASGECASAKAFKNLEKRYCRIKRDNTCAYKWVFDTMKLNRLEPIVRQVANSCRKGPVSKCRFPDDVHYYCQDRGSRGDDPRFERGIKLSFDKDASKRDNGWWLWSIYDGLYRWHKVDYRGVWDKQLFSDAGCLYSDKHIRELRLRKARTNEFEYNGPGFRYPERMYDPRLICVCR